MFRTILLASFAWVLTGCQALKPYQVPKYQGSELTSEQIAQVKPKMTEAQIKYLLGSPDFVDIYHPDTWYYLYTHQNRNLPRAQNKLVLHFKSGKLYQLEGDYVPPKALEYTVLQ